MTTFKLAHVAWLRGFCQCWAVLLQCPSAERASLAPLGDGHGEAVLGAHPVAEQVAGLAWGWLSALRVPLSHPCSPSPPPAQGPPCGITDARFTCSLHRRASALQMQEPVCLPTVGAPGPACSQRTLTRGELVTDFRRPRRVPHAVLALPPGELLARGTGTRL